MTEKNRIRMRQNGREIDIKIIASSEAMAIQMYEAIELALIQAVRIDLEDEWQRDDDKGDRDG